jgi:CheY-like chemotaxis protein
VVDITYRKRLDEQRLQAQKMESLGVLAGGIAHDFNNLLLAISGNARLALADMNENDPAADSLQEIVRATTRATDLVRRILAFSRPNDHKREPVYISAVMEEVLGLARAVLPAGIVIKPLLLDKSLVVLADTGQIHQAVINLLTNAADAVLSSGGEIEVLLEPVDADQHLLEEEPELHPGRYARISIIDNGAGMDTITLERIFDPFFTTKPVGQGTGLGLAIVHGIMKGQDDTDGRAGRILYVDDEDALVFLLTRTLQRAGHQVSGFTSPEEAIHAFSDHPDDFDLIVSDMSMPGMSGLELARKIFAIRPEVPFIITTGFVRAEDYQTATNIGVRQLILKPNTVDELSMAIQTVLQERVVADA